MTEYAVNDIILPMAWDVVLTTECAEWYGSLSEAEQDSVIPVIDLLEAEGPTLRYPHSSGIMGSAFSHMRELRIQHQGEPYRILYAFDPKRTAVLLIGGCKTGDNRWYETNIPKADRLYADWMKGL